MLFKQHLNGGLASKTSGMVYSMIRYDEISFGILIIHGFTKGQLWKQINSTTMYNTTFIIQR